eukprot:scaffold74950_cov70-Cyclotella_meneghiniana.AAC.2
MQCEMEEAGRCKLTVKSWSEVSGEKATRRKESIRIELEHQMSLDENGLTEEDQYLLELNLDDLDHSTGEDQAIWLLLLKAARKAQQQQLRENRGNKATRTSNDQGVKEKSQYYPGARSNPGRRELLLSLVAPAPGGCNAVGFSLKPLGSRRMMTPV